MRVGRAHEYLCGVSGGMRKGVRDGYAQDTL